jgi:hypothetical protein
MRQIYDPRLAWRELLVGVEFFHRDHTTLLHTARFQLKSFQFHFFLAKWKLLVGSYPVNTENSVPKFGFGSLTQKDFAAAVGLATPIPSGIGTMNRVKGLSTISFTIDKKFKRKVLTSDGVELRSKQLLDLNKLLVDFPKAMSETSQGHDSDKLERISSLLDTLCKKYPRLGVHPEKDDQMAAGSDFMTLCSLVGSFVDANGITDEEIRINIDSEILKRFLNVVPLVLVSTGNREYINGYAF